MSGEVINVENLSKRYIIGHQSDGGDGLRHRVESAFRNPARWLKDKSRRRQNEQELFWALKDVSFAVNQGDVVGIIGRNGAGKSTILKILSRITEPTSGRIRIKGRVASLLEVGTGFHQELTGRENIFLNGAILGMNHAEIKRKFDEIVAFSEVEKFLDTPVKRYSSGMYVRLAFAVAAHLEPEILIVDEVLAVGDAEFQKKCLGKIQDVAGHGRTILFVSHNAGAIARLCSKVLYLKNGQVSDFGPTTATIQKYISDSARFGRAGDLDSFRIMKSKGVRMNAICLSGKNESRLQSGEPLQLSVEVEAQDRIDGLFFGVTVINQRGDPVGSCLFRDRFGLRANQKAQFSLVIAGEGLAPSTFTLSVGLARGDQSELMDAVVGYPTFEVLPTLNAGAGAEPWDPSWGSISFKMIRFEQIATHVLETQN
jgi:lipopolysaccharide transport system ATP-binding protein